MLLPKFESLYYYNAKNKLLLNIENDLITTMYSYYCYYNIVIIKIIIIMSIIIINFLLEKVKDLIKKLKNKNFNCKNKHYLDP